MILQRLKMSLKQQRGAVFLLFATVGLPMILASAALAINFATFQVQKTQLQTAADAAALAGAAQYASSSTGDALTSKINTQVQAYVEKNIGNANAFNLSNSTFPSEGNISTVNIQATQGTYNGTGKTVTVDLRRRVPLYFFGLRILPDFTNITLAVRAVANYEKGSSNGTPFSDNNPNNPFNYGMATSDTDAHSIHISSPGMYYKGNLRTNGKIYAPNYANWTHTMIEGSIYSDAKDYEQLWNNLGNNGQQAFPYEIEDYTSKTSMGPTKGGEEDGQVKANAVLNQSKLDVSLKATNTNTSTIQTYINNIINMSAADRETNHIYYSASSSEVSTWSNTVGNYNGLTISGMDNAYLHAYNVIIANGSIKADPQKLMSENTILISLNGDIEIHNGVPFTGVAYAPNGSITVNGSAEVKGSLVAGKKGNGLGAIILSTSGQKITYGTGGTDTDASLYLIE